MGTISKFSPRFLKHSLAGCPNGASLWMPYINYTDRVQIKNFQENSISDFSLTVLLFPPSLDALYKKNYIANDVPVNLNTGE